MKFGCGLVTKNKKQQIKEQTDIVKQTNKQRNK